MRNFPSAFLTQPRSVTIAILATFLLGLLFVAVFVFGSKKQHSSYVVVLRYDADSDADRRLAVLPGYRLKNKTMTAQCTELVAEVRLDHQGMQQLEKLKGCEVHSSVILSEVDARTFKKLGINVTCEPQYQTSKLFHN